MQPTELTPEHLAYWISSEDTIGTPNPVLYRGEPGTDVGAVESVITETQAGPVVRVPWKPDEIDLAHLAKGGTLWVSTWGGLPPHMLEVQEP